MSERERPDHSGTRYFQRRVGRWQEKLGRNSIVRQADHLFEEVEELEREFYRGGTIDQIEDPETDTSERMAREATDCIISALGLIDALGYDFYHLFDDIMDYAELKYSAEVLDAICERDGCDRDTAMKVAKEEWDMR